MYMMLKMFIANFINAFSAEPSCFVDENVEALLAKIYLKLLTEIDKLSVYLLLKNITYKHQPQRIIVLFS